MSVYLFSSAMALHLSISRGSPIGSPARRWVDSRHATSASWGHVDMPMPRSVLITFPYDATSGMEDVKWSFQPSIDQLIEYSGIASTAAPKRVNSGTQRPQSGVLALHKNALCLVVSRRL
ncbi:hypothetical protein F5883DRAFT_531465 [Diaporthe sp. PMI_573]|nr:hypothetical protein F5883DRAFT_531465 [Diaporthaceae sp. PMI_573]